MPNAARASKQALDVLVAICAISAVPARGDRSVISHGPCSPASLRIQELGRRRCTFRSVYMYRGRERDREIEPVRRDSFPERDAERQPPRVRYDEIEVASQVVSAPASQISHICVVPVRMQEAWLLFDEQAIRVAAGSPGGVHLLGLPRLEELESLPDPKATLHGALERASGLVGRRLKKFEPRRRCFDVAEAAADGGLEPLTALPAFARLMADVAALRDAQGFRRSAT